MTAVVITASLDPAWVRPLAALRRKGIAAVVVALDQLEFRRIGAVSFVAATRVKQPIYFKCKDGYVMIDPGGASAPTSWLPTITPWSGSCSPAGMRPW